MAFPLIPILSAVVKPVGDLLMAGQRQKAEKNLALAKIAEAKITNKQQLALKNAEWEALTAKSMMSGWKDEYLTVVITCPFVLIFVGAIYDGLVGKDKAWVLDSVALAMDRVNATLDGEYGVLMMAVVFSGIGIKWMRGR